MFYVPFWEKFRFLLSIFLASAVAYFLGHRIWHAGAIFRFTVGLWGPTLIFLAFVFFSRVFRLEA